MNSWSWTRRVDGPRSTRLATMRLLVAATRGGDALDARVAASLLDRVPADIVVALARYHGVSGILARAINGVGGAPAGLLDTLRAAHDASVEAHLRKLWELSSLGSVLNATGARWAIVKGPVAVERLYASPGERPYIDLDVLVEPARFENVLGALETAGSSVLDRNWLMLRRDLLGEVHLQLPAGTPLDLHWNLLNMNRGRMWIDTDEVLARAIDVDLGGVHAPTLSAEDTVLHLAVHAAVSGGDRLLWLKDVERAAAVLQPDWSVVAERAEGWAVAAPVGLILARSRNVLGAPIPAETIERLLGRRARRLVRLIERVSPWELSVGRLTAASHVMSRTISHGPLATASWLIRRSVKRLDPREPAASSAFTARGGESDRRAWLDAVARAGR